MFEHPSLQLPQQFAIFVTFIVVKPAVLQALAT